MACRADSAFMADILATLDGLLAEGRRVYLHCRAGIGRTGTVVACHLIEQGLAPEAALARLNEFWQTSDRSDTWPEVPETDAQRDFIRAYSPAADPTRAPEVMDAARTLRDRFQGALLGLAVGDALAAHTQYRKPGSFAAVGDLLGGGPFDLPRGAWTDDTAMALLLAESLLECDGFDAQDQVNRYVRWQTRGVRQCHRAMRGYFGQRGARSRHRAVQAPAVRRIPRPGAAREGSTVAGRAGGHVFLRGRRRRPCRGPPRRPASPPRPPSCSIASGCWRRCCARP